MQSCGVEPLEIPNDSHVYLVNAEDHSFGGSKENDPEVLQSEHPERSSFFLPTIMPPCSSPDFAISYVQARS